MRLHFIWNFNQLDSRISLNHVPHYRWPLPAWPQHALLSFCCVWDRQSSKRSLRESSTRRWTKSEAGDVSTPCSWNISRLFFITPKVLLDYLWPRQVPSLTSEVQGVGWGTWLNWHLLDESVRYRFLSSVAKFPRLCTCVWIPTPGLCIPLPHLKLHSLYNYNRSQTLPYNLPAAEWFNFSTKDRRCRFLLRPFKSPAAGRLWIRVIVGPSGHLGVGGLGCTKPLPRDDRWPVLVLV